MLAQSFVSAAELGITEQQREALQKVLVLLETGKMVHVRDPESLPSHTFVPLGKRSFSHEFNMADWSHAHDCGTVCCIAGTAEMISGIELEYSYETAGGKRLHDLFYPRLIPPSMRYQEITPAQAARALRSYLTCGDAKWNEAVA